MCRSDPQMLALLTRTRAPSVEGAGASTTRTPSSVLRTALIGHSWIRSIPVLVRRAHNARAAPRPPATPRAQNAAHLGSSGRVRFVAVRPGGGTLLRSVAAVWRADRRARVRPIAIVVVIAGLLVLAFEEPTAAVTAQRTRV